MSVLFEIVRADPTDTQVLGRYMSRELAMQRAQDMADGTGKRLRVVQRGEVLESWTVKPENPDAEN